MKRRGPLVTVTVHKTCRGCEFLSSEKYVCQSDWGYDYYCSADGKQTIGEQLTTPSWCPFVKEGTA